MKTLFKIILLGAAATVLAVHGASAAESPRVHPAIQAAVDSPQRLPRDYAQDENRHYPEILQFFGVLPRMSVIEMFAGDGNTAEVLARIVGRAGLVYMQNPEFYYQRFGRQGVEERLEDDRLPNLVRLDRPLNDLDLEPGSLDGAVAFMVLHDFFWLTADVPAVLKGLNEALKPGGWFGIVDHAAPEGTGAEQAMNRDVGTHRIEEAYVKQLFADAGFAYEGSIEVLRNSQDDRSKAFFDPSMQGKSTDRFVLKFRKK